MGALEGKAAVITGAATGIGRATAVLFARAGARLTLADARGEELARTAGEVRDAGVGTMTVGGTVETIELDRWDLAQDVNVRAMYLVSRAAIPAMRRAGGGSIINTASVSAFRGSTTRPSHAYAASKGAVLALTRAMAASYGRDRIRVNAICPGTIRTRLTADIIERVEREVAEGRQIPLGRVGEPEDIARCALFLASDEAAWISGTQIVVDGGALAAAT
ncbi:MAG TPA: SDR family oxidoreductase [Candidatus Binatia bacterium]|nr:SDR family oxidoreductase [Candidatus Binatia bacterium]